MFDFDKTIGRRNTCSETWNVKEGKLPMWGADMDFQTAPPIIEALRKYIAENKKQVTEYLEKICRK